MKYKIGDIVYVKADEVEEWGLPSIGFKYRITVIMGSYYYVALHLKTMEDNWIIRDKIISIKEEHTN